MCGRYVVARGASELAEAFDVDPGHVDEPPEPDYNVAPTKSSSVVVARLPKDAPDDAEPVRQLRTLKWGLVAPWEKNPDKPRFKMINARAETLAERSAYRKPFASRRGILPIDGFYEWRPGQQLGKNGKPLKQPFCLRPMDNSVMPLAVLYEYWWPKEQTEPVDPLITFTIVTTEATDDVGHIHDRMPMTVARDHWADWLDPRITDPDIAHQMMAPPPLGSLDIYPVSKAVNNTRNNGPGLIEPLPAEG